MKSWWPKVRNCWKQIPIEGRGAIAICIPLLCLVGTVVAYTILRQRMLSAQMYVDHTNEVLSRGQSSLISLLNAETGVRGYYITKQPVFLESYKLATSTLNPALSSLEQLVADNPSQSQRVKLLIQIADARMALLQQSIARVQAQETSTMETTVQRLLNGKREMDRFRQVISEFESVEYRLLRQRTQALQAQQEFNADAMWIGILIGLIGTAIAVRLLQQLATELREREFRLRESRSTIAAIVANIVDGVTIVNTQGTIETFNNAAIAMFGYTADEVIGCHWHKLLNQEADNTQKMLFYEPAAHATAMPSGQIWQAVGQRKNGELFPIEISMNSIEFDDDRIAIIRDITERQQTAATLAAKAVQLTELNASLSTSNDRLIQSNEELDRFAYITSHDLKAPLRAIASLAEWIEEDLGEGISEETRMQLYLLRGRVYRMQALLNSLLEYSRAGRTETTILTINVEQLLQKVIQALAPPPTFTIIIEAGMPTLTTRWQPLEQVFSHLIDNAIRHHPTKVGIVKISAIDLGDRYEFAITDNGDGIELEYQTRIYTIFQTLKARDLQENVGAGLAIVKKIVAAEGGIIQLESIAGKGAIFRFTWLKQPIVQQDITTISTPRSIT
jgi:PAS domain S-box-containing protein